MAIEFYQLSAHFMSKYPPNVRGKLSEIHNNIVSEFIEDSNSEQAARKNAINAVNYASYVVISGDAPSDTWNEHKPLHTYPEFDEDVVESVVSRSGIYISKPRDVDFESAIAQMSGVKKSKFKKSSQESTTKQHNLTAVPPANNNEVKASAITQDAMTYPTEKSDLYIQSPTFPQFDIKSPLKTGYLEGSQFAVYASLPKIPTKQNEISATTDPSKMTDSEFLNLFPNKLIRTRSEIMYEPYGDLYLHPMLGLVISVEGFTEAQVIDNIVKYPHLFKLLKEVDGELKSFYNSIEIDGELHKVSDVWDTLPDSKKIPYHKDFIKEYVVRRYLLERDIQGVEHRYKMYGTLDPFLTLFTIPADYYKLGYKDYLQLAKDCVYARVNYKRSRNPVLRRLSDG